MVNQQVAPSVSFVNSVVSDVNPKEEEDKRSEVEGLDSKIDNLGYLVAE